jgi:hypothetical protein
MKYLIILILTIFLMSGICYADDNYWKSGRGAWDISYVCMSGVGFLYINKYITDDVVKSILLTVSVSAIKEILDSCYSAGIIKRSKFMDNILDYNKGGDPLDVGRCLIGITITLPLRR